jgi:hypothetical protein
VTLRRHSLDYTLLASFARVRAERVNALSSGTKRLVLMNHLDPRDPTQVPDGDLGDAIKEGNPVPSDFNDDGEDETLDDLNRDEGFLEDDEEDED